MCCASTEESLRASWKKRYKFRSSLVREGREALRQAHVWTGTLACRHQCAAFPGQGAPCKGKAARVIVACRRSLLHALAAPQIHTEVTEFWSVLETVAAARHAELLGVLNKHLQELSAKVWRSRVLYKCKQHRNAA
eukprot:801969-Pelagomonas_calceolata.AAC.5